MFLRRFNHVLRLEAGADGADGGAAGEGAAGAAGAGAGGAGAGDAAAAGGGAAATGTALGAGAAGGAAGAAGSGAAGSGAGAAGASGGGEVVIPEKFVVKGADGQVDHAATARKVAEGYTGLEKRFGSGDAPPATVDGYKVNVPEALKDKVTTEDLAKNEGVKGLLTALHGAGASQKVVDIAVGELLQRGMAMREAQPVLEAAECTATLRQVDGWKSDTEYSKNIGRAFKAGESIFGADFKAMEQQYGNDPRFIKGLASIGAEMEEDRGVSAEAQAQLSESLDKLQASPEYLNASHPMHAATVARVDALTLQLYGNKPVSGGKTVTIKTT